MLGTEKTDTAARRACVWDMWTGATDKELAGFLRTSERQIRRDRNALDLYRDRERLKKH